AEVRDPGVRRRTVTALARHYRRRREIPALLELWDGEFQTAVLPRRLVLERLAMIWEWALRDPRQALMCTDQALGEARCLPPAVLQRLRLRRDRLVRKLSA
ncbi:MAG TPA: hypothetical protein VFW08_09805, partial [bacterium]|nr:hypothetical protein [bacterium]